MKQFEPQGLQVDNLHMLIFLWQFSIVYRERRQDKMTVDKDIRFLSRVASLPIITTAFGQLTALYKQTKDSNRLFKYTLDRWSWTQGGHQHNQAHYWQAQWS